MIHFILWKWKDERWNTAYTAEHVNILADSIHRNYKEPHTITCITDDATGIDASIGIMPLWEEFSKLGHCYRRLRIFSESMRDHFEGLIVSIDLDTVVTGGLSAVLKQVKDFAIAEDGQAGTPYNGSFFAMYPGCRDLVYTMFQQGREACIKLSKEKGYAACDQAIIAYVLGEQEKTFGTSDGLYSYKHHIAKTDVLPENAKLVFFHGKPKPEECFHLPWVKEHYRRNRKGLLVLGGAACVWDDLKKVNLYDYDVMCVNDIGCAFEGDIKYWVTLHPENMEKWQPQRKGNQEYQVWTHAHYPMPNAVQVLSDYWRASNGISGSSGLFAAQIGIHLGYDQVTLAGIPMTPQNHYFDDKPWEAAEPMQQAWKEHFSDLTGRVFSLSGWTRFLLGYQEFSL